MFLTVREVSVMLRISAPTVRKLVAGGMIRSVKLSARGVRIPKDAVEEYLRTLSHDSVGVDATSPDSPGARRRGNAT